MPRKPRTPATDQDTRQRILTAAAEIFAAGGLAGARIDEIAERAGVNKAMLYYHVGDKERLYAAVLTETVERGLASLRGAVEEAHSPSEKLQAVLDTMAAFATSHPVFIPIMLREVASGGRTLPDEMLLRMTGIFRVVAEVLGAGVSAGAFRPTDPLLTHVSLVGSILFVTATQPIRDRVARTAGLPASRHTSTDLARHVGNLFLHGLETGGPRGTVSQPSPRKRR